MLGVCPHKYLVIHRTSLLVLPAGVWTHVQSQGQPTRAFARARGTGEAQEKVQLSALQQGVPWHYTSADTHAHAHR